MKTKTQTYKFIPMMVMALGACTAVSRPHSPARSRDGATPETSQAASRVSVASPNVDAVETRTDEMVAPPVSNPPEQETPVVDLEVPGFESALVAPPPKSSPPRPVIIAAHGAGDTPESQCDYWRRIVKDCGFVLCTRGKPMDTRTKNSGYFYPTHRYLHDELVAATDALEQRYANRIAPGNIIYTGFSQGATMGVPAVVEHPARFPLTMWIEGGAELWNARYAQRYKHEGGLQVAIVCGQASCAQAAKRASQFLDKAGVLTQVRHAEGQGHTYGGRVEDEVRQALFWLTENDSRWQCLADSA